MRLSLALVFLLLVYVYPLRMVAELTLASFSGGWLEETPIVVHTRRGPSHDLRRVRHRLCADGGDLSCCCTGTRWLSPTRSG